MTLVYSEFIGFKPITLNYEGDRLFNVIGCPVRSFTSNIKEADFEEIERSSG